MGQEKRSSTEGDGDRQKTPEPATEGAERQAEAAVNPAVAFTLLDETEEGTTEEAKPRERRNDAGS